MPRQPILQKKSSPLSDIVDYATSGPPALGTSYPGTQPVDQPSPTSYIQPNGYFNHLGAPGLPNQIQSGIDATQGLARIKPDLSYANFAAPQLSK